MMGSDGFMVSRKSYNFDIKFKIIVERIHVHDLGCSDTEKHCIKNR